VNVRRQTVPRCRTSDAECSVPETSSGTRDDQVCTSCGAESRADRDSFRDNITEMTKSIFIQFNRLSPQSRLLLPLGHIRDVMLVWRKQNINRTVSVLQYRVPWYEQFLQIIPLYRALILLGLALCLSSASYLWSSWCYVYLIFLLHSLPFSKLSLVGLALDLVD